ncbi:mechanosensitive ion channel [Bizionia gelidisalsuginis]|uniref:Mechanosensitive ion channel n=2 Tax=Bizionia TaxID=283785 RepID=A0A8H2LBI1_9FLAO|nr:MULTISPECIES: mechanosensitive ion channel domain-containing protein [Bizionia]TYB72560.1 mechanosensitive ion channel [Bizionia saleffrena]TYC09180.1 mechanosensitive ion channel [Bizionia gelidisalsuginis]
MVELTNMQDWFNDYPFILMAFKFMIVVLVVTIGIQLIRAYLKRKITNTAIRYKAQKGTEVFGYILLFLLAISYFSGSIKDLTLIIGVITAGLAFALQELILSIVGSIYILLFKVYQPGDRIEINNIKGDVIDVDSMYTTMMEIGGWISGDNYSGRIVKLSNAYVFKGGVYNYSQDFPFIWDELDLPIRYGSDIDLAKAIVIKIASEILSEFTINSKSQWEGIVKKYYIEDAEVQPTLAVSLTDNWIKFNLRYIVDFKKRRSVKHHLSDRIRVEFENSEGKIVLASATIELIKIPELDVKVNIAKQE